MKLISYNGKIYRTKRADVADCCDLCAFQRKCKIQMSVLCIKKDADYYFKEVKDGVTVVKSDG